MDITITLPDGFETLNIEETIKYSEVQNILVNAIKNGKVITNTEDELKQSKMNYEAFLYTAQHIVNKYEFFEKYRDVDTFTAKYINTNEDWCCSDIPDGYIRVGGESGWNDDQTYTTFCFPIEWLTMDEEELDKIVAENRSEIMEKGQL